MCKFKNGDLVATTTDRAAPIYRVEASSPDLVAMRETEASHFRGNRKPPETLGPEVRDTSVEGPAVAYALPEEVRYLTIDQTINERRREAIRSSIKAVGEMEARLSQGMTVEELPVEEITLETYGDAGSIPVPTDPIEIRRPEIGHNSAMLAESLGGVANALNDAAFALNALAERVDGLIIELGISLDEEAGE